MNNELTKQFEMEDLGEVKCCLVATSTCEADYITLRTACKKPVRLKRLLRGLISDPNLGLILNTDRMKQFDCQEMKEKTVAMSTLTKLITMSVVAWARKKLH